MIDDSAQLTHWTFLSNHTHVLFCIHHDPDIRLRDIAHSVGVTERAAQRILNELHEVGVLYRERRGRRNHYKINANATLRHPLERHCTVGQLLSALVNS